MALKITFYDPTGKKLDEVQGIAHCVWLLDEIGRADIVLPITEPKLNADLIRYGNLVLIEHKTCEDWGGVIRVPERWSESEVQFRAQSAESLLMDRTVDQPVTITGSSGDVFSGLIALANKPEDTGLRVGTVDRSGTNMSFTAEFETIWQAVKRLRQFTRGEWAIVPKREAGGRL